MKDNTVDKKSEPTKEMIGFFVKRTTGHIKLVQKCARTIAKHKPELVEVLTKVEEHDASKFKKKELVPYIWLTEFYRCKDLKLPFSYPEGMQDKTKEAWAAHYTTNSHHPEYHKDVNKMPELDIAEMVADWAAMSEEKSSDLKEWVDANIDRKWKFNADKKKQVYALVDLFYIKEDKK